MKIDKRITILVFCSLLFLTTLIVGISYSFSNSITSKNYTIKDNTIYAVPTSFSYKNKELLNNIKYNDKVYVYNKNNELIENGTIGTGYKVKSDNQEYNFVLKGDVTGDGFINLSDISKLYNSLKGNSSLNGAYLEAGKLTNDKNITLGDVSKLYNYFKGKSAFTYYSDEDLNTVREYLKLAKKFYDNNKNSNLLGKNIIDKLNIEYTDRDQIVITRDGKIELAIKKHGVCYRKEAIKDNIESIEGNLCDGDISAFASNNGRLHIDGTRLVNEYNEDIKLIGLGNETLKRDYIYNSNTISSFKKWGINLQRIFVDGGKRYNNHFYYIGNEEEYLTKLYNAIDIAIENDMYVVVNWNPSGTDPYYNDAKVMFETVASRYPNDPHIIYELWNEPDGTRTWAGVKEYYNKIIPIIRNVSPDAVIFAAATNNCSRIDEVIGNELEFNNVMYSYHMYANGFNDANFERVIKTVEAGDPVFVTEWSSARYDLEENINEETMSIAFANLLEKYKISSSYFGLGRSTFAFGTFLLEGEWDEALPDYLLTHNGEFLKKFARNNYNNGTYVMKGFYGISQADSNMRYRSSEWIEKITSVEFKNSIQIPTNAEVTWDLSASKDSSVVGYLLPTSETDRYKLVICANGIVNAPKKANNLFAGMTNLKTIDFTNFSTHDVVSFSRMFADDTNLESVNLSGFDVDILADIDAIFYNCTSLKSVSFDGWNAKIKNIKSAFTNCRSLEHLDLSGINVENFSDYSYMFNVDVNLKTLNISTWDSSKVTSMKSMFNACRNLEEIDMSLFDFQDATDLTGIFTELSKTSKNINFKIKNKYIEDKLRPYLPEDINVTFTYKYTESEAGSSGETLWTFDPEYGTLEISGFGAMEDYSEDSLAPWYKYKDYIKNIVVGKNITKLGKYAFYNLDDVESVRINSIHLDDLSYIDNNTGDNFTMYNLATRHGATLTFGVNVTNIPRMLFQPTTYSPPIKINKVIFEGTNITSVGRYGLSNLKTEGLILKEGITSCDGLSFGYGDSYLITLPNSLVNVSDWSINGNKKLEKVVFGPTLSTFKKNTVSKDTNLKTMVIPHIENTTEVYAESFTNLNQTITVYGDSSTKSWVDNVNAKTGKNILVYKLIDTYQSTIKSNTNINTSVGYNGTYSFTTSGNVKIYYTFTDSSNNTHLIEGLDITKNGNIYIINNIKQDVYIEIN